MHDAWRLILLFWRLILPSAGLRSRISFHIGNFFDNFFNFCKENGITLPDPWLTTGSGWSIRLEYNAKLKLWLGCGKILHCAQVVCIVLVWYKLVIGSDSWTRAIMVTSCLEAELTQWNMTWLLLDNEYEASVVLCWQRALSYNTQPSVVGY